MTILFIQGSGVKWVQGRNGFTHVFQSLALPELLLGSRSFPTDKTTPWRDLYRDHREDVAILLAAKLPLARR